MTSKRFFVFAILLYCNLFLSSCSSDLNFDQINDFSAEPEIVGNLAYFEYLSNTAAPLFSIEKTVPFDFVNEKFVANNVDYVKLLFELESKEARNYQVELVFKDEFDQPIENITIDQSDNFDGINKLTKEKEYSNSELDFLRMARSIEFTISKIGTTTPLILSDDLIKLRSSALINLVIQ